MRLDPLLFSSTLNQSSAEDNSVSFSAFTNFLNAVFAYAMAPSRVVVNEGHGTASLKPAKALWESADIKERG